MRAGQVALTLSFLMGYGDQSQPGHSSLFLVAMGPSNLGGPALTHKLPAPLNLSNTLNSGRLLCPSLPHTLADGLCPEA